VDNSQPKTQIWANLVKLCDNCSSAKNGPDRCGNTKVQGLATSLDDIKEQGDDSSMSVPENGWHLEDPDFAITFLETAQRDHEHALFMRVYYAKNARKHGITNKRIGQIYGLTEGAVRAMIKKADD